ncbi:NAD(P)/FAD-dependent oxidoreductase [Cohnella candidum]|uniref:NAD(P)/FAD-dependent oxidoreductase n=1 Tax=Cohnella candidum TaxID=2674991 RepID=A0A3G3K3E2_9BACL|nr:FAD-dependent monooxygenase [Cohnella candidum]AYQ75034.1 NAD(P)/FAD-dependent oxidoreductase [Cohnella candidum]
MKSEYDVIVVGARAAGAALAYELAQEGFEVLLLDENLFPSDTLCVNHLHGDSLAMLHEMGVLDRLLAAGGPRYRRAKFYSDGTVIGGLLPGGEEASSCLCVRRQIFDNVLLDHAKKQSGVRMLEGFKVVGLLRENGVVTGVIGQHRDGRAVSFSAHLVVGADGRMSTVRLMAESARIYSETVPIACYVAYVTEYEQDDAPLAEFFESREGSAAVFPTSGGRHAVRIVFPLSSEVWCSRFSAHPETAFPAFVAEAFGGTLLPKRLKAAKIESVRGAQGFENGWYQGMGAGWALAGDALTCRDPRYGQGVHDALYGAKLLAAVLSDYHPRHWGRNWELIGSVYQSALEKRLLSRFRQACTRTEALSDPAQKADILRRIAADPSAAPIFLGFMSGIIEPEEWEREIGRLTTAQPLPQ